MERLLIQHKLYDPAADTLHVDDGEEEDDDEVDDYCDEEEEEVDDDDIDQLGGGKIKDAFNRFIGYMKGRKDAAKDKAKGTKLYIEHRIAGPIAERTKSIFVPNKEEELTHVFLPVSALYK